MAEQDQHDDVDLTDDEAKQLLVDADEEADRPERSEKSETDTTDWKAEAEKWKKLSRKNENAAKSTAEKLKQYEDANKSEFQRIEERAAAAETRAAKAESTAKALQIAMERAPEHATLAQVRAVAKRVRGDDEDALAEDADELFALLAPEPKAPKTPSRPKERLKGAVADGEPDAEPEITDPRKLAAMVPRRR